MIRLFGRKKPDPDSAGEERSGSGATGRRGYSIEELAAAFPDAAKPDIAEAAPPADETTPDAVAPAMEPAAPAVDPDALQRRDVF